MLKKLLKYDLKNMYKFLIIFYILSIFFAIVTRILFSLNQTVIINIISQISLGCMFSMMGSSLVNTFMRNWVRFNQTVYGDESYLTHTLPTSKKNIFQSKFILALINLLTTFIVIILGLFIAYYTKDRWIMLKQIINSITNNLNISTFPFIAQVLLVLFLELLSGLQCGTLGLIIGHRKNNNKMLWSVVFGFMAYIISQIFVLLIVFLFGLVNKDIMSLFTTNTIVNTNIIKASISLAIVIYLIINTAINLISNKILNKGVNIE